MTNELNIYGNSMMNIQLDRAKADFEYQSKLKELHESEIYQECEEARLRLIELSKREEDLKKSILDGMVENGLDTLEFDNQKFTVKNNPPSLIIDDESLIDKKYFKVVTSVDKTQIKKDLKEGVDVMGVHLESGHSLVVTPK